MGFWIEESREKKNNSELSGQNYPKIFAGLWLLRPLNLKFIIFPIEDWYTDCKLQ